MDFFIRDLITDQTKADLLALLSPAPADGQPDNREHINVHINCRGGDVFAALDMFRALQEYRLVTVFIEGVCASAASVVACAAHSIMAKHAIFMLHNPGVTLEGTFEASDLQKNVNALESVEEAIAQVYAQKSGKTVEDIRILMREETWLTAVEAQMQGFVDEVDDFEVLVEQKNGEIIVNNMAVDPTVFKKPDALLKMGGTALNKKNLLSRLTAIFTPPTGEVARIKQLELENAKLQTKIKQLSEEKDISDKICALIEGQLNSGAEKVQSYWIDDRDETAKKRVISYANGRGKK